MQGVRYSNTFIAKKVHLKRVVSIVPCHTSVHQAKSAVKKSRQKLQNSAYGCRCQLGNMAVDRCVRSVTYHWITLRSPILEGVMQSQLVSFHRPFEAGSLKLYLTPTPFILEITFIRPKLENFRRTPRSCGCLFGDLLGAFVFFFIRFLLRVI